MWLQKLPFAVKLLLYVLVIFLLGTFLGAIISLIAEPNSEEVSGWCITTGIYSELLSHWREASLLKERSA